eukprot:5004013-Pleurochrysis_carterae.AAC.1
MHERATVTLGPSPSIRSVCKWSNTLRSTRVTYTHMHKRNAPLWFWATASKEARMAAWKNSQRGGSRTHTHWHM